MSLNIKNHRTCQLADELARLTGETRTTAVTVAIEERLERVRRQRTAAERLRRMREISKPLAARLREAGPPIDHGEFLYDERGLPKGSWVWDDPEEPAEPSPER